MCDYENCQGFLKQQCQDSEGLYEWTTKHFNLQIAEGIIEVKDAHGAQSSVSIFGSKYSKEWSYSSSLSGFGFDLVWSTGKIWSFLVENEEQCKKWVHCLNYSIMLLNKLLNEQVEDVTVGVTPANTSVVQHQHEVSTAVKSLKPPFHISDSIDNLRAAVTSEALSRGDRSSHRYAHSPDDGSASDYSENNQQPPISSEFLTQSDYNENHTRHHSQQHTSPSRHRQHYSPIINLSAIPHDEHSDEGVLQDIHSQSQEDEVERGQRSNEGSSQSTTPDSVKYQSHPHFLQEPTGVSLRGNTPDPLPDMVLHASRMLSDYKLQLSNITAGSSYSAATTVVPTHTVEADRVRDTATAIENELHNNLLKERSRSQQLERQIERKALEADLANQQLNNLQQEMMSRIAELQAQIDTNKEKERNIELNSKTELESRILKAANDNNAFYEASTKASKIQHQRELACLREELVTERKRHNSAMEKEVNLRHRSENQENVLKVELNSLNDKINNLQIEYANMKDTHMSEAKAWERERKKIEAEYSSRISVIEKERDQIHSHAQQEYHHKTQELSAKYQSSLAAMQKSTADTLKQEYEGDLLRQSNELAKKCQHEIELVRTEERKLASLEINNLRAAFMKREHCTAEDLIQLEKLHTTRVSQLEQQIYNLKTNNDRLNEELRLTAQQVDKGSEASQQKAIHFRDQMEKHSRRAELLTTQLQNTQTELQQSQAREGNYRGQLSKALEDLRVKSAELIAAKQQVSIQNAQAAQWKKVSHESDLSISAHETNLQIAREEVSMLEFEMKRLKEENAVLKQELVRADKLIYGVPQHQSDPRTYVVEMENHNYINNNLNNNQSYSHSNGHNNVSMVSNPVYATPRASAIKKQFVVSTASVSTIKKPKIVTPVVAHYTPNTSIRSFTGNHRGSY